MTIKLADHGDALTPRALGVQIRRDVLRKVGRNESVLFDFRGVRLMSTGFAKELFGELLRELGNRFPDLVRFEFGENREILLAAVRRGLAAVYNNPSPQKTGVTTNF